jgi:O-acetyl-ADP-ribose deacetylase (regulator of RNase III)
MHGGGVAGAISAKGGPAIQYESKQWIKEYGCVPTGQTAFTGKGKLGCNKYCIHAVGPIWNYCEPEEADELLQNAIINSYKRADELDCESIAIPAISSGIFGYPLGRCAKVFAESTKKYIDELEQVNNLKTIVWCNIDPKTIKALKDALKEEFKLEISGNEEVGDNFNEEEKVEEKQEVKEIKKEINQENSQNSSGLVESSNHEQSEQNTQEEIVEKQIEDFHIMPNEEGPSGGDEQGQ